MYLPLELGTLVCRHLAKAELKVARLICKSFDRAAAPFLFDKVLIAATNSDLQIADLVASRFGAYVKTVTLSCVEYKNLSREDFRRRVKPRTKKKTLERINAHLEHAFEVYCRAQTENVEINQSGELIARLTLILSKSPNSRRMMLANHGIASPTCVRLLHPNDPWKQDDLCPFKVCKLSVSDHLRFHVRPTPRYQMTPNPFHLASLAISAAKSTITEIGMLNHRKENYGEEGFLAKDAFEMTPRLSHCVTLLLQQLTKLRLRLSHERRFSRTQLRDARRPIAKALSVAVNLESLFIEGYQFGHASDSNPTTMSNYLGGCHFPKMRSLILSTMSSNEDELLGFLKGSPCLKHLTIDYLILEVGSWEAVARRIRSAFRLESFMFDHLSGGFPGLDEYGGYTHHTSSNRPLLENFFLSYGENPFTKAAMDSWHENVSSIDGGLNCEERYEMFH